MPYYRLYFVDWEGGIDSVEAFSARDDVEAIRLSRDEAGPRPLELWCNARLVEAIPPAACRSGAGG